MSEFLAEASVVIRPDVTKFRSTLLAELEAATKGIIIPIQVVASQQAERELRRTVVATESATAARQKQAVADAVATKTAVDLAEAQRLSAVATAKLAEVETADALAVTEVAGAKAKLRTAEAALTAARRASAVALATENVELKANVASTLAAAEAQVASARAAAEEAVAHAKASHSVAAHAAAEHALARGAAATGLTLTGLRGATLAASGPFLAGAAAVTIFEKSLHEASQEQEAAARATKVFGDSAEELEHDAEGLADTFGLSTRAALEFEGRLGNLFHNAGIASDEAAHLSETLVKLAADEAAFANVPVEDVLSAITLGLVGNSRGLRRYQIELNQARVNQEALRLSGKENVKQLSQEDRIRARINLLLDQTANVQGAAARRAGDLAQQEKIAKANLENFAGSLGRLLIPVVTEAVQDLNFLAKAVKDLKDIAGQGVDLIPLGDTKEKSGFIHDLLGFAKDRAKNVAFPVSGIRDAIDLGRKGLSLLRGDVDDTDTSFKELHQRAIETFNAKVLANWQLAGRVLRQIAVAGARFDFRAANNQLDTLDERLTDVKISGGDAVAQLRVLAQEEAKARAAVAAAERESKLLPGSPAAQKRRREAKSRLLDIIEEERSIRERINADAVKAAEDIQRAAEEAAQAVQDALDAADQAFLDALGLRQGALDIRQLRVEATKSLEDDVAFQRQLQTFLVQEIAEARKTISNELLRAQTIQQLTAALVQSQIAEKELIRQQKLNAQQRRQEAFNRAAESIDLDIELAQTNKNIRAEVAARERRIKLDQERLKAVRGDILATKRLRNDIAAQRAAIKELRGDLDKRRKDLEALEFEFLQSQSGFVANLLSNLLPTASVAGTVGAGAISTPTGQPVRPPGAREAGAGVVSRQQQSAQQRGVTQGQGTTQIELLRQILAVLQGRRAASEHPEAAAQRGKEAVSMDFFNW